jgi:hypothetical protein
MKKIISVSVNPEDVTFMKSRNLSPSGLLKQRIVQIRDGLEEPCGKSHAIALLEQKMARFGRFLEENPKSSQEYLVWRDRDVVLEKRVERSESLNGRISKII